MRISQRPQTEAELGPGPGASKSRARVPLASPGGMSQWSDRSGAEHQPAASRLTSRQYSSASPSVNGALKQYLS